MITILITIYVLGVVCLVLFIKKPNREDTSAALIAILSIFWPIIIAIFIIVLIAKTLYFCYDAIVSGINGELDNLK